MCDVFDSCRDVIYKFDDVVRDEGGGSVGAILTDLDVALEGIDGRLIVALRGV